MFTIELQPAQARAFLSPATEQLYGGAAGGGKLLPLDTAIPTPAGWETMATLKCGSVVFDENGSACRVTRLFAIDPQPELYRLTFDDGSTIDACKDHQWLTLTAADLAAETRRCPEFRAARRAKRPSRATGKRSEAFTASITARNAATPPPALPEPSGSIKTTAEIYQTLRTPRGRANHAVPVTLPLKLPHANLPIDPYILGVWLGDGTSSCGQVTGLDQEIYDEIEWHGYAVKKLKCEKTRTVKGLVTELRALGVLNNKHVPQIYLRASAQQRLALLQGLMDTDGTVARNSGSAEFCNTNPRIVSAMAELACSLGWKAVPREGRAMLYGKDCGPKWTVKFMPTEYVFRLPRKIALQKKASRRTTRYRYIVAAERIASRPGRCIEVDSPSHLYLAGRDMIPTHNSYYMRAALIAWATSIPGLQCALFRRMYPDLRANHMEGPTSFPVLLAPYVNEGFCRIVRDEITFKNGSRISLNHCQHEKDMYRYQGAEFHVLALDELTHFTEAIYRFLRGRVRMTGLKLPPQYQALFPRIIAGTNPGGVGHVWVKNTFVKAGEYVIHRTSDEEGGMLRQYCPAKLSDNPALLASDPNYAKRLAGLGDATLVRAMMEGDWSIVAGSMFGDVWRPTINGEPWHVCNPFCVPIDWRVWRGADDGYAAPACVAWLTQDPNTKTYYVLSELYRAKMLPKEMAQRVYNIDRALPRWQNGDVIMNKEIISGELDSAAFSDTGTGIIRGDQINAELAALGGGKFKPVLKGPESRVHAVQNFHRLLAPNPLDPAGRPGIQFFRNCAALIEEIPALPRDKDKPEDVDTDAPDHGWDAVRYGLQRKIVRAGKVGINA